MKFKTDENLPAEAAVVLREAGFDSHTVWDEDLHGVEDQVIGVRANAENRILITLDLDFADIRAYPPGEHAGIVVLRLKQQDTPAVVTCLRRLILALAHRDPSRELWIVERDRIRFRRAGS